METKHWLRSLPARELCYSSPKYKHKYKYEWKHRSNTKFTKCNWNVNGKNALVEKAPGHPRINKLVKYVSNYTKFQYMMRNCEVKFIQVNVLNIHCTL